jgi:hypothetical protein
VTARYGDVAAIELPLDVYVELALAFLLSLAGAVSVVGAFTPLYSAGDAAARCVHDGPTQVGDCARRNDRQQEAGGMGIAGASPA